MRYYVIAGEASGDLHASKVLRELKLKDSDAHFRFWGGDKMAAIAGTPVKHIRDLAFMGFWEVIKNLPAILNNFKICKKDICTYNPDALVLVDYPGFNLRIAKFAARKGIKVFYYISPTIWAWKESRVNTVKKYIDRMFVILPFEKSFYKKHEYDADFVGHPLLDEPVFSDVSSTTKFHEFIEQNKLPPKKIIAVLPGSRKQELEKILPPLVAIADKFSDYQFVVAGVGSLPVNLYNECIGNRTNISVLFNKTYDILQNSTAAIVKSGTSTLETALLNVPQVVCYKTSAFTYMLAKQFAKVKYISLVNLILDRSLVTELIQDDLNIVRLENELTMLLHDSEHRKSIFDGYSQMRSMLGSGGASERVAEIIYNAIKLKS